MGSYKTITRDRYSSDTGIDMDESTPLSPLSFNPGEGVDWGTSSSFSALSFNYSRCDIQQ